jgi:hypothetical protein
MTATEFSTISILLSLASLLGSFFYIQLSNWLRELITLKAKFDFAENGQEPDDLKARYEVRYALRGLNNRLPFGMWIAITAFIAVVSVSALLSLLPAFCKDPLAARLTIAFVAFLTIYLGVSILLLVRGYDIGRDLLKRLGGP